MKITVKLQWELVDLPPESELRAGSGGRSGQNGGLGFSPAYLDHRTFTVYASRFADGRLAPLHTLDGLPDELVIDRTPSGHVLAAKATLIPGFVRNGFFYTRTAAARAAREWSPLPPGW